MHLHELHRGCALMRTAPGLHQSTVLLSILYAADVNSAEPSFGVTAQAFVKFMKIVNCEEQKKFLH